MTDRMRSWIEGFFLALIIVRPSLDATTGLTLSLGPVSLNPAGFCSMVVIALGILWAAMLQPAERSSLLDQPIVKILLIWIVILIPWAVGPVLVHGASRISSVREWLRLLSIVIFFIIVLNMTMQGKGKRILAVLFLSLIVPALTGLYQIAFHQGMQVQEAHRIQSTFVHPNPFSFYLVLMAGAAYWKCRWAERRTGWILLLFLTLGLLIATFSFTGAGMLGVLIMVTAIGENRWLRYSILCFMMVFVVLFVATPTGRERIRVITQWDNLDEIERTGRETSSLVWRLLNWRFLYRTWIQNPYYGYGLDSAPYVNPNRVLDGTGPGQEPHNDYVRFMIDGGIIGFILNIGMLAGLGLSLFKAYRMAKAPPVRHFIWAAIAIYASWLAGSANDNLINATAYQYCLWLVFALALGWAALEHQSEDSYMKTRC
jgi:O-antigen ligase